MRYVWAIGYEQVQHIFMKKDLKNCQCNEQNVYIIVCHTSRFGRDSDGFSVQPLCPSRLSKYPGRCIWFLQKIMGKYNSIVLFGGRGFIKVQGYCIHKGSLTSRILYVPLHRNPALFQIYLSCLRNERFFYYYVFEFVQLYNCTYVETT